MLFVCENCNTVENSAYPQNYLATLGARVQVQQGEATEPTRRRAARQLLCTACEPRGRWHEKFVRRKYDAERDGRMNEFRQLVSR